MPKANTNTKSTAKQKSSIRRVWKTLRLPQNRIVLFTLITSSIFGLLFMFLLPPMQGADEPNHFLRAYQVSEGDFISDYVKAYGERDIATTPSENVGGAMPKGLVQLTKLGYGDLPGNSNAKFNRSDLDALAAVKNQPGTIAVGFPNTAVYSPVAYVPSIPGIELGRLFHVRPLILMYLARLSGLIIGIALITWAIYLLPFGRLPFAAMALLPMTIGGQMSVVTADTATISLSFLAIALCLHFGYQKRDISRNEIILLLAVFGILSLTKPAIFPIALLSLALLRNRAIVRRKAWKIAGACMVVATACTFAWNEFIKQLAIFGYTKSYAYSNYNGQLLYIENHPLKYISVLFQSLFTQHFDLVPGSFIGNLGWLDTPLPQILVAAGFVILAFSVFISSQFEAPALPRWLRSMAGLGAAGIIIITLTSQYLFSMPVGYAFVDGMQGRYFIPAALLVIIAFLAGTKTFSEEHFNSLARRCLWASTFLLAVMTVGLLLRYYAGTLI